MAVEQTTERINRHQLVRLLDTMASVERQAITQRTLVAELETAVSATTIVPSGPRHPRPASHVAALLPPVKSSRPMVRATPADEDSRIVLSPQVIAQLTAEEIAMLPPRFQP